MNAAPKPRPTRALPARKPASESAAIVPAVIRLPTTSSVAPPTTVGRVATSRSRYWASAANAQTENTNRPPTAWFWSPRISEMMPGPSERYSPPTAHEAVTPSADSENVRHSARGTRGTRGVSVTRPVRATVSGSIHAVAAAPRGQHGDHDVRRHLGVGRELHEQPGQTRRRCRCRRRWQCR